MNEPRLKILPPWVITCRKFEALFDGDPQIGCNINFSGDHPSIVLACNSGDKVAALQRIVPDEIGYGGVRLQVKIDGVPSNRAFKNKKELFEVAFHGNPAFAYAVAPTEEGYSWFDMVYVVFNNCVVQFYADNLNDCHGIISTLYQDIAAELLCTKDTQGVYFNTNVERGAVGKSLGQWP